MMSCGSLIVYCAEHLESADVVGRGTFTLTSLVEAEGQSLALAISGSDLKHAGKRLDAGGREGGR